MNIRVSLNLLVLSCAVLLVAMFIPAYALNGIKTKEYKEASAVLDKAIDLSITKDMTKGANAAELARSIKIAEEKISRILSASLKNELSSKIKQLKKGVYNMSRASIMLPMVEKELNSLKTTDSAGKLKMKKTVEILGTIVQGIPESVTKKILMPRYEAIKTRFEQIVPSDALLSEQQNDKLSDKRTIEIIEPSVKTIKIGARITLKCKTEPAGIKATDIKWVSSNIKIATVTSSGCVTGKSSGIVKIKVALSTGETDSIELSVNKTGVVTLVAIAISKAPTRLAYEVGDDYDMSGLEIIGMYSDKSIKQEKITLKNINGFNSSKPAASQKISINISGKTVSYNVTIKPKQTNETPTPSPTPTPTSTPTPSPLPTTEPMATPTPSPLPTTEPMAIPTPSSLPTIEPSSTSTSTPTPTPTPSPTNAPMPTAIVKEIYIAKLPTKIIYLVGEPFDASGLEVVARFSDGTTRILDIKEFTITGFDSRIACNIVVIEVSMDGKIATFPISIR